MIRLLKLAVGRQTDLSKQDAVDGPDKNTLVVFQLKQYNEGVGKGEDKSN
jgi:hypothetical protein